jgi:hypothetical protein
MPPKKVLSVLCINWLDLIHKADYICIHGESALIPIGHHAGRESKLTQGAERVLCKQGTLAELKTDDRLGTSCRRFSSKAVDAAICIKEPSQTNYKERLASENPRGYSCLISDFVAIRKTCCVESL